MTKDAEAHSANSIFLMGVSSLHRDIQKSLVFHSNQDPDWNMFAKIVDSVAKPKLLGMNVIQDASIPPNEVHFLTQDGVRHRLVNLGKGEPKTDPAPAAPKGPSKRRVDRIAAELWKRESSHPSVQASRTVKAFHDLEPGYIQRWRKLATSMINLVEGNNES